MKVIKRNGAEVDFSREKIYKAIKSANEEVRSFDEKDAASDATINTIAENHHGGGHACASGATVYSEEEMMQLVAEADALIKNYKETHEGWL